MSQARYIDARLSNTGGDDKIVSVRVVSMHQEDDALRQDIYTHDEIGILVNELRSALPKITDPTKLEAAINSIASLRTRRDKLQRSLIERCLDKKYNGEQKEEIYKFCDTENIGFIILYNALCGISAPLRMPLESEPKPVTS
jgi:hypothetical protein